MRVHVAPDLAIAARQRISRSPEWPRVERAHLAIQPRCACCAEGESPKGGEQVHHIIAFHICIALGRPDLDLDRRNLVTLCQNEPGKPAQDHHLLVGHLDDFESMNLAVLEDAAGPYHALTAAQLRASPTWKAAVRMRTKPLAEMTELEKQQLAQVMNLRCPRR